MYLYSYKKGSKSANALSHALGIKQIKHDNSKFKGNQGKKVVINWGSSNLPDEVTKCLVLNWSIPVDYASNKLKFFDQMSEYDVSIPSYTRDKGVALNWVEGGCNVVCRSVLNGHSGQGITIATREDELVDVPLYVKYIPKKDEYRVHFGDFGKRILDIQRKGRDKNVADDDVNWQVRNLAGGFIYMREGIVCPEKVLTVAKECAKISGLNFGAVDVIYNKKHDQAYALEINTAPGLMGTTLERYVEYFKEYM